MCNPLAGLLVCPMALLGFIFLTRAHCLDLVLNGLLTRRKFWRIPGMLGNYTIPKWKEFLKPCEPIQNSEKLPKWHFFTHAWKSNFFGGQMPLFEVLRKCHLVTLSKICLWLHPCAYLCYPEIAWENYRNSCHLLCWLLTSD